MAQGIDNYLDKALKATQEVGNGAVNAGVNDKLVRGIVQGAGGALTENLLYGTDFETALKNNLMAQLVDGVSAHVYSEHVKGLDTNAFIDNISHKLAAGLTGCISSKAKDKSCEAGAVGAVIGEMVGDWMTNDYEIEINGKKYLTFEKGSAEYNKILNTAKLTAGSIALLYDFDVDTAVGSAKHAVVNNAAYSAGQMKLMYKRDLKECASLGIPTNQCGQYQGEKSIQAVKDLAMFFIPTEPYEIVLTAVSGGSFYVIRQGGKALKKGGELITFENKADAEQVARMSGMLRTATIQKGNFGIGQATRAEADLMGKAWVGNGYKTASDGKTLVSADGLRTYRPPSPKKSPYATTGVQANFETLEPVKINGVWKNKVIRNGHLNILD